MAESQGTQESNDDTNNTQDANGEGPEAFAHLTVLPISPRFKALRSPSPTITMSLIQAETKVRL